MTALAGAEKTKPTASTAAATPETEIKSEAAASQSIDLTRCENFLERQCPGMPSCELIVMLRCLGKLGRSLTMYARRWERPTWFDGHQLNP